MEYGLYPSPRTSWQEAVDALERSTGRVPVTLTFVRDPVPRFLSAVTTLMLRGNLTRSTPDFVPPSAAAEVVRGVAEPGCLRSERVPLLAMQAAERRAANVLCILTACERRGLFTNPHVYPQISLMGMPVARDAIEARQPTSVLVFALPEGVAGVDAMASGWLYAASRVGRDATPGLRWNGSHPQLPTGPIVHNNHSSLALDILDDADNADNADAVAHVWRVLERDQFAERVRRLYAVDYTCLWSKLTARLDRAVRRIDNAHTKHAYQST